MIKRLIKEINVCLNNNCILAALSTALTLPDICGIAAYGENEEVGIRYIKWFNENIFYSPFNDKYYNKKRGESQFIKMVIQ